MIYQYPNLVALSGALVVASLVGVIIQAAIDEPWIAAIGIGGWGVSAILSTPGTNGRVLLIGLTSLGMVALILKFVGKNWRKSRVWVPLSGLILATGALLLLE